MRSRACLCPERSTWRGNNKLTEFLSWTLKYGNNQESLRNVEEADLELTRFSDLHSRGRSRSSSFSNIFSVHSLSKSSKANRSQIQKMAPSPGLLRVAPFLVTAYRKHVPSYCIPYNSLPSRGTGSIESHWHRGGVLIQISIDRSRIRFDNTECGCFYFFLFASPFFFIVGASTGV